MVTKITVRAPSSTANLGPGFDTFGLAIDAFYDEVTLTKIKSEHYETKLLIAELAIGDEDFPAARRAVKEGIEIKIKKGDTLAFANERRLCCNSCIDKLFKLKLSANTVIVVEHDEDSKS